MDIIYHAFHVVLSWSLKYLRVYRILFEKRAESFVFLGLTLVVGALGLWAPSLIASVNSLYPTQAFVG